MGTDTGEVAHDPPGARRLTRAAILDGMSVAALDQFEDPDFPYGSTDTIQRAWAVMAGGSTRMAKVLLTLAENSKSDFVKVQAAIAVLDRVGLTGQPDININVLGDQGTVEVQESAAALVMARLDALAAGESIVEGTVSPFVDAEPEPDVDMFD
ncbi:MAG TPA: hypothetical protein VIT65_11215 [Microlunatus sp.]